MKRLYILVALGIIICLSLIAIGCPTPTQTPTATQPTQTTQPPTTTQPPAQQVAIRVTCPIPAGDPLIDWCQEGFDRFNERTNGAYKMQMYPGQQLASMGESLDAIRTGAVEGGVIPPAAYAGTVPEFVLGELPFLYNNAEANAYAEVGITELYNELLEGRCNQKSLGCFFTGGVEIISTKPIHTLDDWDGLIVECGNPSAASMITALGGSPMVTPLTDTYSNLQKGVVDASTQLPQFVLIAKLHEAAKYYTVFFGLGSVYSVNLNLDVWNEMPQNDKDILTEEMNQLAQDLNDTHVTFFYNQIDALSGVEVDVYYVPSEERDQWMELCLPQTNTQLAEFGETGQRMKQIADDANAMYPYNR
jgi:TRAP-type C4-dicarboxylate transport system substrate-binding protein